MLNSFSSHVSETNSYCFSSVFKGKAIKLYDNGRIANGDTGYRSVLGTKGISEGTFYYEAMILNPSSETLNIPTNPIPTNAPILEPLLHTENMLHFETNEIRPSFHAAHTRIGFATKEAYLEIPVGADVHGYSYRDLEGTIFHDGYGSAYGSEYGLNSILGCLIHLQPQKPKIRGLIEEGPVASEDSFIQFFVDGMDQGVAFRNINEGSYFPAVGLYQHARVELNLSSKVAYPRVLETFKAQTFGY